MGAYLRQTFRLCWYTEPTLASDVCVYVAF